MATFLAALAAKTVEHGGVSKGGCPPFGAGFEGAQPLATFRGRKDGLGRILRACGSPGYANKQFRTAPDASGEWAGQERVRRGRKTGVSQRVWPPRRRGDSGTANNAAPKDSTTRAAKDGPVWFHCSAPAVRYEGECGADSAHASHSENEPSMKGLK